MFEHDQKIVQRLLVESNDFKDLYQKHQELDEKVDKAGLGVLPLDDVTLEKMKKQKLLVKDKMALMIEKYRRSHGSTQ
ncbi:MAG: YdcH family protein [Acidiferrobacterales bacterium]